MKQTISRAAALAVALVVPAAAQPASEIAAVAGAAHFQSSFGLFAVPFRPTQSPGMPPLTADDKAQWERELGERTSMPGAGALGAAAAPAPAANLDLAALLGRHLKTNLRYALSGRTVWFSGAFDRAQKPYVSVLVDGAAPRYFDVKALLDREQRLSVGGAAYTLSLSPNIFHRMKSTINLKNDSNAREAARFTVQDMLDAVAAAGEPVRFSDQQYRFYYADGVGAGATSERMFVFIYGGTKDFRVYLVPESAVPTDRLGVFSLFNGKRVGLARRAGRLEVYENP